MIAGATASIPLIIVLGRVAAAPMGVLAGQLQAPVAASALLFLVLPTTTALVPILDTVYPLFSALVLVAGITAVERGSRAWAACTGALVGLSVLFSALLGIVALPLAIFGVFRRGFDWVAIGLGIAALLGGALSWLLLWLAWGINMPDIFRFLAQHQRDWEGQYSYWLWFRWKWYDFVMFCGLPVAALCLKFLAGSIGRWRGGRPLKIDYFFAAWLAMMIFLWITPTALAEVGRLWAPLMCFAAIFAAWALPKARGALPVTLALQIAQIMVLNRYLVLINPN